MRPEIVVGSGHSEVGPNGPRQAAPGQATTSLARAAAAGRSGGAGGQQGGVHAGARGVQMIGGFPVAAVAARRSGRHGVVPLKDRTRYRSEVARDVLT